MSHQNKIAVVSGGSKGLGLSICNTLLGAGYKVSTFSRSNTNEINELQDKYTDRFFWSSVDIGDYDSLKAYVSEVKKRFGRIGYLVNSAGVATENLLTMTSDEDVSKMLDVNLRGTIGLSKMCVKHMIVNKFGVIVNISSIVGMRGYKGVGAYSATKSAIDGLTRSMAGELGYLGIRVNSVAPGFMATEMTEDLTEKQMNRIARRTPLSRLGTPEDISDVVKFMLSEDARFVTGQTVVVDGGFTV